MIKFAVVFLNAVLFIAQLLKQWTDREEAKKAVAADLEEIASELTKKARTARDATPTVSVRDDPHNRDNQGRLPPASRKDSV